MDLEHLLNDTLEEFFLQYVGNKIEEVSELPEMLKDIHYLMDKQEMIAKTTRCEILGIDNSFVDNYSVSGNEIHIEYEIEFILQTFIDSEFIWRVQGCAQAKFAISGPASADWLVFDELDNDFFDYYEKYKEYAHFEKITYTDIECDTISV